jgi:hypothetical protein
MSRVLSIALALLAVLAGCGGDEGGGGGDGGGGELSREAFVAEANEICREGEQAIAGKFDDEAATPESLEEIADAYEPYLGRLRALEPPSELSDDWDDFLGGVAEGFELLPDLARAAEAEDTDELERISQRAQEIAEETRPFAQSNDLDDCLPDGETGGA